MVVVFADFAGCHGDVVSSLLLHQCLDQPVAASYVSFNYATIQSVHYTLLFLNHFVVLIVYRGRDCPKPPDQLLSRLNVPM